MGDKVIKKLRSNLNRKEIDVKQVALLIRQLKRREKVGLWVSAVVVLTLAVGLGVGVVLSIWEVIGA